MTDFLRRVIEDPRTERVITALILLNAVLLGLETSPTVMAALGSQIHLVDNILLGIFVLEIAVRIAIYRTAFFRDPWSLFDFFVVGVALVPATDNFSVFRALRVLRVLRLITAVPALKRVVTGLLGALPGMGSIVLLIGLLYYVFSVMATKLYGADHPELFGSLPATLFTLFTVMTLEGWAEGVVKPVMQTHPYAWIFFIAFIIICTFMVLNLFIGVVVNAMQDVTAVAEKAERQADRVAERKMIEDETRPLFDELQGLRAEIAQLRTMLLERKA